MGAEKTNALLLFLNDWETRYQSIAIICSVTL